MRISTKSPIGIFDSGIGGTSIWREINNVLPLEKTIYLADSKNAPYGQKSTDEIIALSIKNTEFLLDKNCKLIVVACNTATTNAIKYLRNTYSVPFIGIEPAIKPASLNTRTKTIGILATKGTLNSALFAKTADALHTDIHIVEQVGDGLVDLIEKGLLTSDKMTALLQKYLIPLLHQNIDHLVLGCTHYPYLIPQIKKIIGNTITIIDSGEAVAKQTKRVLDQYDLIATDDQLPIAHDFYSNSNIHVLKTLVKTAFNCRFTTLDF